MGMFLYFSLLILHNVWILLAFDFMQHLKLFGKTIKVIYVYVQNLYNLKKLHIDGIFYEIYIYSIDSIIFFNLSYSTYLNTNSSYTSIQLTR